VEDATRQKVMTLPLLNEWLEKVMPFSPKGTSYPSSRGGNMPPGLPPRPGLVWKPETHRWIRPEDEDVREEKKQPRLDEIKAYVEDGGYAEIASKAESALKELFPENIVSTRMKEIGSILEKEKRPKYRGMTKEKAVERGFITEDEDWNGMEYKYFTDIVGGRVSFDNATQVSDAVKAIHEQAEKLGFKVTEDEDWINNKHPSGYYRRYHMLLETKTEDGKTVTMELQLGTANQTKISNWAHDLLHKGGGDRPILTSNDRRSAFNYITQMSELYAYHDGVEGAKNAYPADCIEVIRKFAGCLDVPES
jgi:ppGpp synthetase/RelA/SpoT-type nucleotidyltranferase